MRFLVNTLHLLVFLSVAALFACSQTPSNDTPSNNTPATPPASNTPSSTTSRPPSPPERPKPSVYASAKEGWLVDVDEAYALSVKTKKPILANFTGSDWCGWCKRLDADVFSKPAFQEWAKKNVVLLEVDFPRRFQIPPKNQQQNASLQRALGIRGYPTVWVMNLTKDAGGQYQVNGLGSTGYSPSVDQFIAALDPHVRK